MSTKYSSTSDLVQYSTVEYLYWYQITDYCAPPNDEIMEQDNELLCHGLGYSNADTSQSETNAADQWAEYYMQQCLSYHEEQEMRRAKSTELATDASNNENEKSEVVKVEEQEHKMKDSGDFQNLIKTAQARAREVLLKIREDPSAFSITSVTPSADFPSQRFRAWQIQSQKNTEFYNKNFAYLRRRQLQGLQQKELDIALQQQETEKQMLAIQKKRWDRFAFHKRKAEQQRAGIGTKEQRNISKEGHKIERSLNEVKTVAVYVSGLTETDNASRTLRDLFSGYGNVSKVHQYRGKPSNELKGDGLVVFSLKSLENGNDLLETVCGQVRPLRSQTSFVHCGRRFKIV